MTDEQKLLSDLDMVSADLKEWAYDLIVSGKSADEIKAMLREAVRISGRD